MFKNLMFKFNKFMDLDFTIDFLLVEFCFLCFFILATVNGIDFFTKLIMFLLVVIGVKLSDKLAHKITIKDKIK